MITNEVQYRATKAHLERFKEAAANIEDRPGKRTKLERLELDAVRAQAEDLRAELADFDQLRGGTLSTFDAASLEEPHNPKVAGSNPAPATNCERRPRSATWAFVVDGMFHRFRRSSFGCSHDVPPAPSRSWERVRPVVR